MKPETKEALDQFIDVADEVLFEGNVKRAKEMLDSYMILRTALGQEALQNLREAIDAHGGLDAVCGNPKPKETPQCQQT